LTQVAKKSSVLLAGDDAAASAAMAPWMRSVIGRPTVVSVAKLNRSTSAGAPDCDCFDFIAFLGHMATNSCGDVDIFELNNLARPDGSHRSVLPVVFSRVAITRNNFVVFVKDPVNGDEFRHATHGK